MFALEPGELGKVVLKKHQGTENPPCCVVKAKSVRQQREYDAEYEAVWERHVEDKSADITDRAIELFKKHVEKIEGYPDGDVEDVFTYAGITEVLGQLLGGNLLPYEQKKSSE